MGDSVRVILFSGYLPRSHSTTQLWCEGKEKDDASSFSKIRNLSFEFSFAALPKPAGEKS